MNNEIPLNKIPKYIKIGLQCSRDNPSKILDFNLPLLESNIISFNIDSNLDNKNESDKILELIVLNLLQKMDLNLIDIDIFDPSGGLSFKNLLGIEKIKVFSSASELDTLIESLEERSLNIIQKKLKEKHNSLDAFNENSNLKEPYKVVLISGFPELFNEDTILKLLSLLKYNAVVGLHVYLTIYQKSNGTSHNQTIIEFLKSNTNFKFYNFYCMCKEKFYGIMDLSTNTNKTPNSKIKFDNLPKNLTNIIFEINQNIKKSEKLELDIFSEISKNKEWQGNSTYQIKIPIGISENGACQEIIFNNSDLVHGFIGGTSGTGKTTLLISMILNSSYLYSNEELQFFVVDAKGSELFDFAHLFPNLKSLIYVPISFSDELKIISIEYVREMFSFLIKTISDRKKLFSGEKCSTFEKYRAKGFKLPRIIIILDEFQNLLKLSSDYYKIETEFNDFISQISSTGRDSGLHILLSTQTLEEVQLSKAFSSNSNIRIALNSSENSYLKFFDYNNDDPVHLERYYAILNNNMGKQKKDNQKFKTSITREDVCKKIMNKLLKTSPKIRKHILSPIGFSVDNDINSQQDNSYVFLGKPFGIKDDDVSFKFSDEISNFIIFDQKSNHILNLILNQILKLEDKSNLYILNDKNLNINYKTINFEYKSTYTDIIQCIDNLENNSLNILLINTNNILNLKEFDKNEFQEKIEPLMSDKKTILIIYFSVLLNAPDFDKNYVYDNWSRLFDFKVNNLDYQSIIFSILDPLNDIYDLQIGNDKNSEKFFIYKERL